MIVPSMTVQEIHDEVFKDLKDLNIKIRLFKKDFERVVLKSSRYPVVKAYKCQTTKRKNTFTVTFTAKRRSQRRKPMLGIYGVYSRAEGCYAVTPTMDSNLISIYPPHFFRRYRERILKDVSISNEELISIYFGNGWGYTVVVVNEQFEAVYHSFESSVADDKLSFVAATSQGYCFGENQGSVNIIKTIISEDMLFDDQKEVFGDLRTYFNYINTEVYEKK